MTSFDTEISDKNYNDLIKYLKKHSLYIGSEKFKAVLFAMNLLSNTDYNKKYALKLVKNKFPMVTKKFVDEILKDMFFVSNAKKNANKSISKEMIQFNWEYKDRISREP